MLNWGLGYVIDLIAQIHQKIHWLSINRLLITKRRARAWMIFQSVLYHSQFFPLNSFVSDVKAHLRELQTT